MKNLELSIVNLFMWGESPSTYDKESDPNTTIIKCDSFDFEFKQHNIHLKHNDYENIREVTTTVKIQDIEETQNPQIFEIIDDICWLLSFAQQSPVRCETYQSNSPQLRPNSDVKTMRSQKNIIESYGLEIRKFIEQTYPTFKKLKSSRQLTVVFDYLCEANRPNLALEVSLILHYVIIENLKHTFALDNRYEYSGQHFTHKDFPHLDNPPSNVENYWPPKGKRKKKKEKRKKKKEKRKKYIHKIHGHITSTEMTLRMFEAAHFNRDEITPFLNKRHKMIHEGILLPFNDPNYSKQAREDLHDVSDLLRQYLLTLLNYKGSYYLSRDRLGPSGLIT